MQKNQEDSNGNDSYWQKVMNKILNLQWKDLKCFEMLKKTINDGHAEEKECLYQ